MKEPLKAGYKVRAVAYWRQNTDILLPKGNDYEAAFKMPDDSVLVKESSVVVEPSVSLGEAYADSKTITATVAGTIPEGTALIVRAFDADASDFSNFSGGSFVASSFDVETGAVKLAPSEGSLSAGGKLVAYLVNSGSKVAQSDPVTVKAASQQGDADAISVNAETVTTDATGVTVSVSGHSSYEGGRLIVGQGSYAKDGDSATQLGSVVFTGPGTYSFDWDAGTLKEGKHLVVYLYKYDADRDATSYAYADDIVVQAAGPAEDPDPDPEDPDPDSGDAGDGSDDGKDASKGADQDGKAAAAADGDADESGNKDSDSGASAGKDDSGKKSTGDAAKGSDSKSSKAAGASKARKSTAKTGDDAALAVAVLAIGLVAGGVSAASARKVRRKR